MKCLVGKGLGQCLMKEEQGLQLDTDPENMVMPKQGREPGKIGNPKKSILSDLILEKEEKAITLHRRSVQVNAEQTTSVATRERWPAQARGWLPSVRHLLSDLCHWFEF